jgi:hypothetical protein
MNTYEKRYSTEKVYKQMNVRLFSELSSLPSHAHRFERRIITEKMTEKGRDPETKWMNSRQKVWDV